MTTPQEEDRLAATAFTLAVDVREDLAQAHRTVQHMSHLDLQQLAVVLAAMVDVNCPIPVMAWWRTLPGDREAA